VKKNNINIIESISRYFLDNIIIDLLILEPEAIDENFGISDNNIFNANNISGIFYYNKIDATMQFLCFCLNRFDNRFRKG